MADDPSPNGAKAGPDYGEMRAVVMAVDWDRSPLGQPHDWPDLLLSTLRLILPSQAQIVLFWGPDYVALYNDAYAPAIGANHPQAFGRPAIEYWGELWDDLEPLLRSVREEGKTVFAKDREFYLERHGFPERAYFDISYSPIAEQDGSIAGVLCIVAETSERVRESKALEILNDTARNIAAELDLEKLVQAVVDAGVELTGAAFGAFFYNAMDDEGEFYRLYTLSGVDRSAFENFPMPRNTKLFEPTFSGTAAVRSDDITVDPRYGHNAPHSGMPKGHLTLRSYLAVPVTSRSGEVIGGLFFGHPDTAVFDDRAERLATAIAAQSAVAIDNARLFDASRRLNETLEAQIAERTRERDSVWQVSRDMLGVADLNGVWQSVNPAWTRVLGWEASDIVGRRADWLCHPDDVLDTHAEVRKIAAGEPTMNFENRFRTRDGGYRTLAWTAVPFEDRLYTVARDVTEEREREHMLADTEAQLRQAQKMEAVGQLTGGIAHDFNNLLQIVTGNLETLQRMMPDEAPRLRRVADNAMSGAKRAAILTQRLLAFSRRQPLAPRAIDINRLVEGMSDLLHRTLGEPIAIETKLQPDLWQVEADANQLEGAVLNLAINARDAMPQGGRLTISTYNRTVKPEEAREGEPGDYVILVIADNGTGMDEPTLARAFEPFFTTKDVGKGTGLGLSMVYGFVRQSGGHVRILSTPDKGTTVRIVLPRLHDEQVLIEDARPESDIIVAPARPGETILVCEDDDAVRAHSIELLEELGYEIREAADGAAALRLLERRADRIDLLFTDVVLPGGITGAMVAQQARALRPGLRILFTTGYARDAIVHHGRLDPGVALITKPFGRADLAARVRAMLDQPCP
jgi:PAS domain S-box-containing protein